MEYRHYLASTRDLIAMIHLPALPGTPQSKLSPAAIVERACYEARLYQQCMDLYPRGSGLYAFTQKFGDSLVFLGQPDRAKKAYQFGIQVYNFPAFDFDKRIAELRED